jgi:hypothetical protein
MMWQPGTLLWVALEHLNRRAEAEQAYHHAMKMTYARTLIHEGATSFFSPAQAAADRLSALQP